MPSGSTHPARAISLHAINDTLGLFFIAKIC
jgi:hypothetical protein